MLSKRLCITGLSAIQACDEGALSYAKHSRVRSTSSFAQAAADLDSYAIPAGCTSPIEIIVPDDNHRPRNNRWRAYRRTEPFPLQSLLDIGDDRLLVSPGYFFLKTAPQLKFVQAVLLGMELCGYYSTLMSVPYRQYRDELIRNREIDVAGKPWPPSAWEMSLDHQRDLLDNGFVVREPLLKSNELRAYLSQALSEKSNSRALVASRQVMDDSRSPMESRLYARYCLPRRYGGLNLRPVKLNSVIEVPREYAVASSVSRYSVDLYWPKAGIAIEYQGSFAHSGLTAEQRDRLKRNILQATGIRIISIDSRQYANEDVLDLYATEIARGMGMFPSELKLQPREMKARLELLDIVTSWDSDLYRP